MRNELLFIAAAGRPDEGPGGPEPSDFFRTKYIYLKYLNIVCRTLDIVGKQTWFWFDLQKPSLFDEIPIKLREAFRLIRCLTPRVSVARARYAHVR